MLELSPLIKDKQLVFPGVWKISLLELNLDSILINNFSKTISERSSHIHTYANDCKNLVF